MILRVRRADQGGSPCLEALVEKPEKDRGKEYW